MAKFTVQLNAFTLKQLETAIRYREKTLGPLRTFTTKDGINYAVFDRGKPPPRAKLFLREMTRIPDGVTKIDDGVLSIHGQKVHAVAFREDTLPDRDGWPKKR